MTRTIPCSKSATHTGIPNLSVLAWVAVDAASPVVSVFVMAKNVENISNGEEGQNPGLREGRGQNLHPDRKEVLAAKGKGNLMEKLIAQRRAEIIKAQLEKMRSSFPCTGKCAH